MQLQHKYIITRRKTWFIFACLFIPEIAAISLANTMKILSVLQHILLEKGYTAQHLKYICDVQDSRLQRKTPLEQHE